MEWVTVIGLGIVVFASTNIDDIFVLMMFFSDRQYQSHQVILGQYVGIAILVGVSVIGALAALVIPASIIGLMGFLPIAIGIKKLLDLRKGDQVDDLIEPRRSRWQFLAVAAVTISNGGDNIGVYVPVFANSTLIEMTLMIVVFMVMVALWCGAGYYLVHHSFMKDQIQRVGHKILPFVLMGLGVYILMEAFVQ